MLIIFITSALNYHLRYKVFSMCRASKGHSELHFMYKEAFHQMPKVIKSLKVKTVTKPRSSDSSVSADEKENLHMEAKALD